MTYNSSISFLSSLARPARSTVEMQFATSLLSSLRRLLSSELLSLTNSLWYSEKPAVEPGLGQEPTELVVALPVRSVQNDEQLA